MLDNLTILTGQNNSGKTSFIKALEAAIGIGRQRFTEEDIYLANSEKILPKDRIIIVDWVRMGLDPRINNLLNLE